MNDIISINIKSSGIYRYDIEIGSDLFIKMAEELKNSRLAFRYSIVSDSNVSELYSDKIMSALDNYNLNYKLITFPAGEISKTRKTKEFIEDKMLESKMGRDTAIIALGGGVVGDIAGYVAATYNRGIKYIQYPTSLVACVDSSIGGKTGVDTVHGKNLIGSFHHPYKVYIDINTLKTLDKDELKQGMAEVIKYGVIYDHQLFEFIANNLNKIYDYDFDALKRIIKRSCEIKAYVVEMDEREANLRKILNYGHTIGHAIEQLSDYCITHGEAISAGMFLEAKISNKLNLMSSDDVNKIENVLKNALLPVSIAPAINRTMLIDSMKLDKKTRQGIIEFALPSKIGTMHRVNGQYGIRVDEKIINSVINT